MSLTPNALCFGSDLPGSGLPCRVEISSDGLTLNAADQAPADRPVPFSLLSVEAGGFDHDQLVVKWEQAGVGRTLYIKEASVIASFRQAVAARMVGDNGNNAPPARPTP